MKVTNGDIYAALMDLKEDMGSVKTSSGLQLEALKNHNSRIAVLESAADRQKGSITVWGLIGTGVATLAGGVIAWFRH